MKRSDAVFRRISAERRARILRLGLPRQGKKEAQQWVRQLRTAVSRQLSLMPGGFPLAPENDDFPEEIRQMIVDRYRVLFTIRKYKVHLLHVRGANIRGSA